MKLAYPELDQAKANIISVVNTETEQFSNTLDKGIKIISNKITNSTNSVLSGNDAFTMHDTYGFPIEATLDFAKEKILMLI